jgi:hypothetical protein
MIDVFTFSTLHHVHAALHAMVEQIELNCGFDMENLA